MSEVKLKAGDVSSIVNVCSLQWAYKNIADIMPERAAATKLLRIAFNGFVNIMVEAARTGTELDITQEMCETNMSTLYATAGVPVVPDTKTAATQGAILYKALHALQAGVRLTEHKLEAYAIDVDLASVRLVDSVYIGTDNEGNKYAATFSLSARKVSDFAVSLDTRNTVTVIAANLQDPSIKYLKVYTAVTTKVPSVTAAVYLPTPASYTRAAARVTYASQCITECNYSPCDMEMFCSTCPYSATCCDQPAEGVKSFLG